MITYAYRIVQMYFIFRCPGLTLTGRDDRLEVGAVPVPGCWKFFEPPISAD